MHLGHTTSLYVDLCDGSVNLLWQYLKWQAINKQIVKGVSVAVMWVLETWMAVVICATFCVTLIVSVCSMFLIGSVVSFCSAHVV